MKNIKNIIVILLLFLAGCATKQKSTQVNTLNNKETKLIEIGIIEKSDKLVFNVKNISDAPIDFFQLNKLQIEKYIDGEWKGLRILACPCDAPCNAPSERTELKKEESYEIIWNKQESWCGTERIGHVRNIVRQDVEEGKYRIKISFYKGNAIETTFKEFSI